MGIFSKFFQKKENAKMYFYGFQSKSAPFSGEAWEHDVFRATVDAIATHAAKGQIKHVVLNTDGMVEKVIHNSHYSKLLNIRPNPIMTAFDLKYRLFAQLESQTTAIAYIKWNGSTPEMICPVDYQRFEIYEVNGGGYAIQFTNYEGELCLLPLEDCIVLRKFYEKRIASGDGNSPIYKAFDMSKASDDGFIEHLSVSNKIRGIHKHKKAMLDREDIEKGQKDFAERFQNAAESGGIVSIDSMEEFVPLTPNSYSANAAQMKEINNRIYTFLRTPEEIVQSKYTEQQGFAWYESVIEPLWQLFAEALTNACFTKKEKECGNRIIVAGGVLMGTSYQTRINIIAQTKEIGVMSINEQRDLLGLPPVEGGDKRLVSLNYINSSRQDEYQIGEERGEGEEGNEG